MAGLSGCSWVLYLHLLWCRCGGFVRVDQLHALTMPLPRYQIWSADQHGFNWLTRVTSRHGEYGMRFRYLRLLCRECSQFRLDDVFSEGFDPEIRIKVNLGRNILVTDDYFLCVAEGILNSLKEAGVKGFEHKPLP